MKRKKQIIKRSILGFVLIIGIIIILLHISKKTPEENQNVSNQNETIQIPKKEKIADWKLKLVNYQNTLPEDFQIELSNIDETRKFDSRAIQELNLMFDAMKQSGVKDGWVQSSYRSIQTQTKVFNEQIEKYISQGKTKEEAEKLTMQIINKPGASEHNLGLAVDFNYVDNTFEQTKTFKWLKQNAQEYGFILRYPKEKEQITKVKYEPWHWRYVGKENAKKINELNMCLEEYIEYLEKI